MRLKPQIFTESAKIIEEHRRTGKTLEAEKQKKKVKFEKKCLLIDC